MRKFYFTRDCDLMTFVEAAIEILKREGRPLSVKKLTELAIARNLLTLVGKDPEGTMQLRLEAELKKSTGESVLTRGSGAAVFGLKSYPTGSAPATYRSNDAREELAVPSPHTFGVVRPQDDAARTGALPEFGGAEVSGEKAGKGRAKRPAAGKQTSHKDEKGDKGAKEAASSKSKSARAEKAPVKAKAAAKPTVASRASAQAISREQPSARGAASGREAAPARGAAAERGRRRGGGRPEVSRVESPRSEGGRASRLPPGVDPLEPVGFVANAPSLSHSDVTPAFEESSGGSPQRIGAESSERGQAPVVQAHPTLQWPSLSGATAVLPGSPVTMSFDAAKNLVQSGVASGAVSAHAPAPAPKATTPFVAPAILASDGENTQLLAPVVASSLQSQASPAQQPHQPQNYGRPNFDRPSHPRAAAQNTFARGPEPAQMSFAPPTAQYPAVSQQDIATGNPPQAEGAQRQETYRSEGDGQQGQGSAARSPEVVHVAPGGIPFRSVPLADAAYEVLRNQPDGRAIHFRQLADMAIKRRLVRPDVPEVWRALRIAMLQESRDRLAVGLRPRIFHQGNGLFAVATRRLDPEVVTSEKDLSAKLAELRANTRMALRRRVAKLPAAGFEHLVRVLLERMGVGELAAVKRSDDVAYFGGLRHRGATSVRLLIALRSGEAELGRVAVGELRAGVRVKGFDEGILIGAGRLVAEGQSEVRAGSAVGAATVTVYDGDALPDLLSEHGVGVMKTAVPLEYLDAELFAELSEP